MNEAPHARNCVCVPCLAVRGLPAPSLNESLATERARAQFALCLDVTQRHYLDTFTLRWNKDRAVRGLSPITADDALTEGLRALVEMVTP